MAVGQLPNTVMGVLDEGLSRQAAALGAQHQLRGADAVHLASAVLFAAALVTLDREQRKRGAAIVQTLTPAEFMATIQYWRFRWGITCYNRTIKPQNICCLSSTIIAAIHFCWIFPRHDLSELFPAKTISTHFLKSTPRCGLPDQFHQNPNEFGRLV